MGGQPYWLASITTLYNGMPQSLCWVMACQQNIPPCEPKLEGGHMFNAVHGNVHVVEKLHQLIETCESSHNLFTRHDAFKLFVMI
jgi:hypothetical protein